MPTYLFAGRVLPPFNEFTLVGSVTAGWRDLIDSGIRLEISASLTITKGVVEVACESNVSGTENYDGQVYRRALDLVTAVVSTYAFGKGMGLRVFIETVVKPDGIKYNIQERQPYLEPLVTVLHSREDEGIDITAILPIILKDPAIFVALTDLIESLNRTQDATVRCGRAVEAIRNHMAPENDRKAGWAAMRDNLNLGQPFLEYITESSKGPRHGDVKSSTFTEAQETMRRSWIVMNRFLEFKKREAGHLPLHEFPLL